MPVSNTPVSPRSLLWLSLIFLLLTANTFATGLDARLDRTRISEGETVVLMLRDEGQGGAAPDLTPLMQDFDILNRGQSSRMQMINGRSSSWHEWQITLAPKRTGKLTIPSLRANNASSQPVTLEVLPATQAAQQGVAQPVRIEVEVSPEQPYVQAKAIYTVRVLSATPLRIRSLSDPTTSDAIIEPLGDERRYETTRDGERYRVLERRYAVFAQHSGALAIEPPVLAAERIESGNNAGGMRQRLFGGRDPFADFDRLFGGDPFAGLNNAFADTRPLRVRGERLTMDVRAQPPNSGSPWLPAESLTLNESWSANPPQFRVGEPITRTIAITAQGVSGAQLPNIAPADVAGISVYPDKPTVSTRADGDTLVAQKVISAALVPTSEGQFTLPEIRLQWWDTTRDALRTARLPARDIDVLPGSLPSTPVPPAVEPTRAMDRTAAVNDRGHVMDATRSPQAVDARAPADASYWPWVSGLLALLWLSTALLWWRARARRPAPATQPVARPVVRPDSASALRALERACTQQDAKAARAALLTWAEGTWADRPPTNLEGLAQRLPSAAAPVLAEIDARLYASGDDTWRADDARRVLIPLLRNAATTDDSTRETSALPPLYPT